ncbi:MAG: class I SAM-dependent methyltransferase [archaeon]|nr:MAG: class I SAM-dependent methyltransferase [archaeon]
MRNTKYFPWTFARKSWNLFTDISRNLSGQQGNFNGVKMSIWSSPTFQNWIEESTPELKKWFEEEIKFLKENIKPGSRILDVGCGFGRHVEILAPFCDEVVGIDNNDNMVKRSEEKLAGLINVKIILEDAKKMDFEDNYFDYVICMTNTFGNLADKKIEALKEMKRVCKEGGKIFLSVFSDKAFAARLKSYKKVNFIITKIDGSTFHLYNEVVSEQFTKQELKDIFESAGLEAEIIELTPIGYICVTTKPQT